MKKVAFITIMIISLVIINNLLRSIFNLLEKRDLLVVAQQELDQEKAKNAKLKGQVADVNRPDFIEEQARNKLFLVKPGEQVVIVPTSTPENRDLENKNLASMKPHWVEWWDLVTHGVQ